MRRRLALAAATAAVLAAPASAHAASVQIGGLDSGDQFRYTPADLTARPGDTAEWSFAAATQLHNVFVVPPGVDPANEPAHESLGLGIPGDARRSPARSTRPGSTSTTAASTARSPRAG
jgi:plastocyanin